MVKVELFLNATWIPKEKGEEKNKILNSQCSDKKQNKKSRVI